MKKAINLNKETTVCLNEIGLKIYNDYINQFRIKYPQIKDDIKFNQLKDNKYYTAELWDIIHIFGKQIFIGKDTPFVDNCIHIEVDNV